MPELTGNMHEKLHEIQLIRLEAPLQAPPGELTALPQAKPQIDEATIGLQFESAEGRDNSAQSDASDAYCVTV